jgi:APA family basic amino acid/polyamine antiporter
MVSAVVPECRRSPKSIAPPCRRRVQPHRLRLRGGLISVGAIAGLSSVLVVMLLGQSRVFFAMSRDGGAEDELVSIGTLFAFVLVSAGVLVLRRLQPELRRPFRCPWVPVVPVLAIIACGYLMASLPGVTWLRFGVWLLIGLGVYAFYGRRHSRLR